MPKIPPNRESNQNQHIKHIKKESLFKSNYKYQIKNLSDQLHR